MPRERQQRVVSRETSDQLATYYALLAQWSKKINLTSAAEVMIRSGRPTCEGLKLCEASLRGGNWYDVGSGGGLPGIIIAILLGPRRRVTLVESDSRKCAFLRRVRRELQLNLDVVNARAEALLGQRAETISAQALAPLTTLLDITEELRCPSTEHLFPKGRNWHKEVGVARQVWNFDLESIPSPTEEGAAILRLTDVRRIHNAS